MPEISETPLPGVGVRHEFTTAAGERISVLTHRTGRREIGVYDRGDPDACRPVVHLDRDDTRALTELLGGSPVSEAVTAVQQRIEGLAIEWVTIPAGATAAGATIAAGAYRTRAGASIVAIVRGDETIPAPGPEQELAAGDVVVAVGTPEGLAVLRQLLAAR